MRLSYATRSRVTWAIDGQPQRARALSSSSLRRDSTCCHAGFAADGQAPEDWPADLHGIRAEGKRFDDIDPFANAPVDDDTGLRPATAAATSGKARIVGRTVSSCRPPWLETTMPAAPWSIALTASSPRRIPLTTIGNFVIERSHSTSAQDRSGSNRYRV